MRGWTVGILIAWSLVFATSVVRDALPASWWLDAGELRVSDAPRGTCNQITFNRAINRPFYGEWLATLQRENRRGEFSVYRVYTGRGDYRPDASLPDNLDLGWWFEVDRCHWRPGTYRLLTQWKINPDAGSPRYVRRTSEPFEIVN